MYAVNGIVPVGQGHNGIVFIIGVQDVYKRQVLSFGVTAYAQGWINNLVTVFEQDKMVVTGEQEVDLEQYNKERANATDKTTTYADFATACAAYNLPTALPEELTAANGYKQVNEVTALEVSGQHNAVNILSLIHI